MRHRDRVQRAFELLQPKCKKAIETRKSRAKIVVLPDIGLQQRRMIGKAIENMCGRQPITLKLSPEVIGDHSRCSFRTTISLRELGFLWQVQKVNNMCIINALAASGRDC